MTELLIEAFNKAQNLPNHLQDELAEQLIEDIENELNWQQSLSQSQHSKIEDLATKALHDSINGKTKQIGFDEL
jgi:hypothetical protein